MTGWQVASGELTLTTGAIHVWRIPLVQAPQDTSMLAADEQARAERFRYDKDRRCFVTARCSLRQILGRYLAQDAGKLAFRYGPYGKPFLAEHRIEFNLAHSGDLALVAVAADRPVGIDLELIKPMSDLEKLTERFFTAGEHQRIVKLEQQQRSLAFFRTWTCKEAYLKATGDGLRKLKGLEVAVNPQQGAQFVNPQDWDLQEIQPGEGFVGAIAAPGFDWQVSFFEC
ncbi:4'-phosphopantetheinyl transferase superfamily protein [filamentous cyanobacterium LEGE 11480]|uniref:4'-phosphopantetheinyl transferase superfamily protein n=1 Tax=Romeriopsis navalis LEGE 11480 TaxID=2777977 RepID=A0A928VHN6_9CYAN|nr:4'-phosphopantetheinyl transferase superfamily protein [Romeriopsis navalis]MBE9028530.1 4'-phosphopantetheinyl transferase superfamily protein [Romeriopsis navalis LEGE 11480]